MTAAPPNKRPWAPAAAPLLNMACTFVMEPTLAAPPGTKPFELVVYGLTFVALAADRSAEERLRYAARLRERFPFHVPNWMTARDIAPEDRRPFFRRRPKKEPPDGG